MHGEVDFDGHKRKERTMLKKMILAAAVAFMAAHAALADTEVVDGITWTYVATNGYAVVGDESSSSTAVPESTTGEIAIPSTLGGCAVVGIGNRAFFDCGRLKGVAIPDGVKTIGEYAFGDCSGLKSLTIPDGVASIGKFAFSGCSSLTSVVVPDGVASVGEGAFAYCSGLKTVTIPQCVCDVGVGTVFDAESITKAVVSAGVTNIGTRAFAGCSSLANVTIPEGVKTIGDNAFEGCSGLKRVVIPAGVASIGSFAFRDCCELVGATLPDSVKSIGEWAFAGCYDLVDVAVPEGVSAISDHLFDGCYSLASVTIPDGVGRVGGSAFRDCCDLASVALPGSVTNVGDYAFSGCIALSAVHVADLAAWCGVSFANASANPVSCAHCFYLDGAKVTELTIPAGVASVGDYVFEGCSALTSVTIPGSVTNVGYCAFNGCSGLTSIAVDAGNAAYSSVGGMLLSKDGKTLVQGVNGAVAVPGGVSAIGNNAFAGCSGLSSVAMPDGLADIGDYAFSGCVGLGEVSIPGSVTNIGEKAFHGCNSALFDTSSVPGVKLLDGWAVESSETLSGELELSGMRGIGCGTFRGCGELAGVTIGETVTYMGAHAFDGCGKLARVTILSESESVANYRYFDGQTALSLDANGGVIAVRKVLVAKGKAIGALPEASRDRHAFLGWFTAAEGGKQVSATAKASSDAVYYAHWRYVGSADESHIYINIGDAYSSASDGSFLLGLSELIESYSAPKVVVSGLPSGIKYDSKTMKISGKTTKPGVYAVKVSATNKTVKKAVVKEFTLTVPNRTCDLLPGLLPATDAYGVVRCGVAFDSSRIDCAPVAGWSVKVSGLPAGMKYDSKSGKVIGTPAKAGNFTVTFTASKKGEKSKSATITLHVEPLSAWAQGTFNGVLWAGAGELGTLPAGTVTLTVGAAGKVSGKLQAEGKTWTLSAVSYESSDDEKGEYVATVAGKSGKESFTCRMAVSAEKLGDSTRGVAVSEEWSAWQNLWKTEPWKSAAKQFAGKTFVLAGKADGLPTDGDSVSLKFAASGAVAASGKFVTGQNAKTGKDIVYSAKCSTVLIPTGDGVYGVFLCFPPKAGKFDGFAISVPLAWDGKSFMLVAP